MPLHTPMRALKGLLTTFLTRVALAVGTLVVVGGRLGMCRLSRHKSSEVGPLLRWSGSVCGLVSSSAARNGPDSGSSPNVVKPPTYPPLEGAARTGSNSGSGTIVVKPPMYPPLPLLGVAGPSFFFDGLGGLTAAGSSAVGRGRRQGETAVSSSTASATTTTTPGSA